MPDEIYAIGDPVTVRVNGQLVTANYLGINTKYPGYLVVNYCGKKLLRRRLSDTASQPLAVVPASTGMNEVCVTTAQEDTTCQSVAPQVLQTAPDMHFSINERFNFIAQMVGMVASGRTQSMIVTGSGGLGKTYTVMQSLSDQELEEDTDYILIKGYSTARSLFSRLFEAHDKLIIFDDCDSVLEDKTAVNILKSALDTSARRTVSWLTANDHDLPSIFEFTGRIIFISNKDLNRIPQPLLSRSFFVDVTMTTDEKLERITTILPKLKPGLTMEQKHEVLALIVQHKNIVHDLNIRTFIKLCDIRESNVNAWQRLATYVLLTNSSNPVS